MSTDPIIARCGTDLSAIRALFINGVPLHGVGRIEQVWQNVIGGAQLAGQPFHVPMRTGFVDVPQVPTGYEFTVGMTLYGTHYKDLAGFHETWRTLARMIWNPNTPLIMQRVIDFGSGAETHSCRVRYVSGLSPEMVMPSIGKIALTFYQLDGYWYGNTATTQTITGSGTITMPGDAPTRRVTMEFSGGSNQTLTNLTTVAVTSFNAPPYGTPGLTIYEDGSAIYDGTVYPAGTYTWIYATYLGSTSTPVTMRVETFQATQSSANVVGNVTHGGDAFWMALYPGANNFALTGGGSVEVSAYPAYL